MFIDMLLRLLGLSFCALQALANKTVRMAWVMMTKDVDYDPILAAG